MNINSVNEKLLNVLYYSPSTGISSAKKLYEKVKQRGITFHQVKDYISKQETHQIFKKQPRIKNYFPIVAKYKNEVLQIDLICQIFLLLMMVLNFYLLLLMFSVEWHMLYH